MARLAVTVLDNTPHILGWADEVVSPDSFAVPVSAKNTPTLERLAGSKFYSAMANAPPPETVPYTVKATWQQANHKLRRLCIEPLPALSAWPVTDTDRDWHQLQKRSGPPVIDWANRLKAIHNCPFLLKKYSQLIYLITTDKLKSGQWIIQSKLKDSNGFCPCCFLTPDPNDPQTQIRAPATPEHMFSTCIMVQDVWSEANNLGRTFWQGYTDFNYLNDITLLVHTYDPPQLFKLAVIWALWRYWCKLFYEFDQFDADRLSKMVAEVMIMVRNEMIFRLIEARPVIQWLEINRAHKDECPEVRTPEKEFLLVTSQSVETTPLEFDFPTDTDYIHQWLGNNTMCYLRQKKIVFNHAQWYVYKNQLECNDPVYADSQEDSDGPEDLGPPSAPFMAHDY